VSAANPGDRQEHPGAELAPIAPETCIVIAAFNESEKIAEVVRELLESGWPSVVVTDDGSRDDTFEQAQSAGATALRHVINRGQGAALQTGVTYALRAGARYVVTFDADGQHRPNDLPQLLAPLANGEADFALGSRFLGTTENMPRLRGLTLKAAVVFTRLTSGARVTDAHNGLRAMTRRGAEALRIRMDRMAHASEVIDQVSRSGLAYVEVPVHIRYTEYSRAKGQRLSASVKILVDYFLNRVLG